MLLGVLSWLTRRTRGGSSRAALGRRERVVLTGEHMVHVVEIGGMRLLVGTGPSGAPQLLAELGAPLEEAGEAAVPDEAAQGGSRAWVELLDRFGVAGGR